MWDRIVKAASCLGGALIGLAGGANGLFAMLAGAMGLDYLSGLIVACRGRSPKSETGGVSSMIGFDGLARKTFILLIVLLAALLDQALGTGANLFRTASTCYYIANEGISIMENAALMGVPFPEKIKNALEAFRENHGARGDD